MHRDLVTIGIPTFNRAEWLSRAVDSALCQDYADIEVIISDNGSTDDTQILCEEFTRSDRRVSAVRVPENRGATANFVEVLGRANGRFFMWLGDDDWIDRSYVTGCLTAFCQDSTLVLASGEVRYYQDCTETGAGTSFDVSASWWVWRLLRYYWKVRDNGMFYGLMRTDILKRIGMRNEIGNDWHVVAGVLTAGKAKTIPDIRVHRQLGGASTTPGAIARSLKLPDLHARFHTVAIAIGAFRGVFHATRTMGVGSLPTRTAAACLVFGTVVIKHALIYLRAWTARAK